MAASDVLGASGGVDVNAAAHDGRTPLILAARTGEVDVIRALLAAGADPNLGSLDQLRPLQAAVLEFSPQYDPYEHEITKTDFVPRGDVGLGAVAELLDSGADPLGRYWNGWTALHEAAFKGTTDTARLLLQRGVALRVFFI